MNGAFKQHMKMARRAYSVLSRLRVRGGRLIRGPMGRWVIETSGASGSLYESAGEITDIDNTALTVTIAADDVVLGSSHASSAESIVNVSGTSSAKHYVYAFGSLAPLSIAIAANTTGTFPVHAANQWRRALYEVYVESGSIVVNRIMHLGMIDLTGFYS